MLHFTNAFSGFSVNDKNTAKAFYEETLGLRVEDIGPFLHIYINESIYVFAYPKDNHEPATYTFLNFEVPDIEEAVKALKEKGVQFETYPGTDSDGISRDPSGPLIAWFKDPAGNILAVIQA